MLGTLFQVVITLIPVSIVTATLNRNLHGTPCIFTSDCVDNSAGSSFLAELQPENYVCQNFTCVCNPLTTITVLSESSKSYCRKKLNQNCNPFRELCVDNAECHYSNGHQICSCNKEFYAVKNAKGEPTHCAPKKSLGAECQEMDECQFGKFLDCRYDEEWSSKRQKKCLCWPSLRLHPETHRCVLTAGDYNCREELGCVPNAVCEHGKYSSREAFSQCACKPGTFPSHDGYCFAKEGGSCDKTNNFPCAEGLNCVNNTCSCPKGRKHNEKLKRCVVLAGVKCNQTDKCVQNAECVNGKCVCEQGFVSVGGVCDIAFGQQCNQWSPVPPCNRQAHLVCNQHGICDCKPGHKYDLRSELCMKGTSGAGCEDDLDCSPNSKCHDKVCTCRDGTYKGNDGSCYSKESSSCTSDEAHGGSVFTSKVCEKGLACRNGICRCPVKDHQIYIEELEECRSLVQGPCNDTMLCVENADCLVVGKLKECKCKDGFIPADRLCDVSFGKPCTQGDPDLVCDRVAKLECSVRGICECGDFQYYDHRDRKCRGLVGAKCQLHDKTFCRDGWCQPFRAEEEVFGACQCDQGMQPNEKRFCVGK